MGGMLDKLVSNGNDVTVAYMTNGSVAVFDADVRRYLRFIEMSIDVMGLEKSARKDLDARRKKILSFLERKAPGQVDMKEVQAIKAYIRYAEAIEGLEVMGLSGDNARFLDMPFYKTGRVRKDPIGEADVKVVLDLLEELVPDHVFVAGDLSDPHGTHRMCYQAIGQALRRYNDRHVKKGGIEKPIEFEVESKAESTGNGAATEDGAFKRPLVWLYRGAWQEWEIHRADVFMPMSKADLDRKVQAIYKHESQKDRAMFPGAYDDREFWQRARDRNLNTAKALNKLGLPEFYAAEAYVTQYEL
jgi:glucosamine-6-phosphate deaminase